MSPRLFDSLTLLVGLAAVAGLAALVLTTPPTPMLEAVALLLVLLAGFGLTAPVWHRLFQKLLPASHATSPMVMGGRFGVWTGLFLAGLLLLQITHMMGRILVLALLVILVMLETFFQQQTARRRRRFRR